MELLSIENINSQYFFYEKNRSVVKWLRKRKISVVKLGKGYFVSKIEFENEIYKMLNYDKTAVENGEKTNEPNSMAEHDKRAYAILMHKINEL